MQINRCNTVLLESVTFLDKDRKKCLYFYCLYLYIETLEDYIANC